jgi:hemolysin D
LDAPAAQRRHILGSLQGTLVWVSADAEDKNAASNELETRSGAQSNEDNRQSTNNPNAGYVYKINIRTKESRFMVDGVVRPIQSGMTVQADIVTDRRRVIEFFCRQLQSIWMRG